MGALRCPYSFPDGASGKKPPAVQEPQETWVQTLGQEDPPGGEHGKLLQCSYLENPYGQRSLADYSP